MRAINVLLALAVSLLIAFGVFEGGLRLIGFAPTKTLNQFDENLGWVKRTDTATSRATDEYDVTFDINSLGLRDDPMTSPAKPEASFRVVCLGDSFTLGYTVEREDLFVDQLERKWNAEGRKVDVINTGTEGYSTDQEAVWLLENGDAFQPDLVLLFPYDNDIYWNGQTSYFGTAKPRFDAAGNLDSPSPLADTKEKGLDKSLAVANFLKSIFGKAPTDHTYTPSGGSKRILMEHGALVAPATDFMQDAVARTGGALKALKAKCDALGARLVVAPIPSHSSTDSAYAEKFGPAALGLSSSSDWDPDLPVKTMLALCKDNGIDALDCRAALRAAAKETGQSMYFMRDWHLNPAGNLAFAKFLDRELGALGAFPEAHAASATSTFEDSRVIAAAAPSGMPPWMRNYLILWVILTTIYFMTYDDEAKWLPPIKVGLMLGLIFSIVLGGQAALAAAPPMVAQFAGIIFVLWLASFILYKMGRRIATILELLKAFTLRGHWYLMPLVVVLLSIGSLLVVAASSPLVAPFIYTLF